MSKLNKILIILGSAVIGGLSGACLAFPDQAVTFAGISGCIATLIGIFTGVSLKKES